jgi:UDP-N-acetylglucosamine--N-acetylmuramyl-(pentapeptide) pyrophosphoryl-undecaprenol N-acetylglucosamine transferase
VKFTVTCGGTGGHVFPGVATAQQLAHDGHDVALMLSGRDVETPTANGWSGRVLPVRCPQPRWRTPWGALRSAVGLVSAILQARKQLLSFRPDALLAMGSYTSFGPVLAARWLRIPIVLHDANVIPGSAIARLAPLAAQVAVSFDETAKYLPRATRTTNTGLPVRTELAGRPPLENMGPGTFTVLVMGGSQGARAVNALAVAAFRMLFERGERDWRILHLAGKTEETTVRAAYAEAGVPATVFGFLADMGGAYSAADLCLSRSGAAACFELCLCGPPALLIPLPTAARDHQTANARALADAGAAELLSQASLTPAALADSLSALRRDTVRREAMRAALRRLARPDAAARLARLVVDVAQAAARSRQPVSSVP